MCAVFSPHFAFLTMVSLWMSYKPELEGAEYVKIGKYLGPAIAIISALVPGFGISGVLSAILGSSAESNLYLLIGMRLFLLALSSLSTGFLLIQVVT